MKIDRILKFYRPAIIALFLAFQSCDKEPDPLIPAAGADGFFVVNEGGFRNSNSSISFYDRKTDVLTNNVFASKNGRPLGDQAQSMTVFEGRGYIIVQSSSKIEVIDASDFSSIKTITEGIESPRYFIGISLTKGYLSDWGKDGVTGTVKVINLETLEVTKVIPVGKGTNRFLKKGNLAYVANAGGYDKDNTVKAIDVTTDEVVKTITVGDNPNSIQEDKDGNIWVASGGALVYNLDFSINESASTKGSLSKIGTADQEVFRLTLTKVAYSGLGQLSLSPSGDQLYYNFDDEIYSLSTTATVLPDSPLITKAYYALAIDPFNGNIIGGEALNFSSAGKIDVYNSSGVFQKSYDVGIAPNGLAFK